MDIDNKVKLDKNVMFTVCIISGIIIMIVFNKLNIFIITSGDNILFFTLLVGWSWFKCYHKKKTPEDLIENINKICEVK
jgi:hypothetical protein